MNLFTLTKLLTKNGRQAFAKDLATEYLTIDKIAELVANGVARGLEAGAEKITDQRRAQIANGCQRGGNALIHITAAVSPDGDEGGKVSEAEKELIRSDIYSALCDLVTKDAIDAAIEKAVAYVP